MEYGIWDEIRGVVRRGRLPSAGGPLFSGRPAGAEGPFPETGHFPLFRPLTKLSKIALFQIHVFDMDLKWKEKWKVARLRKRALAVGRPFPQKWTSGGRQPPPPHHPPYLIPDSRFLN